MVAIRRSIGRRRFGRALSSAGLGVGLQHVAVLDAVEQGPDPGSDVVTVGSVAERIGADPSRSSRVVAAAVAAGYVVRIASQSDARRVGLQLTPSGRRVLAQVQRARRRFFASLMATWPERDQREFARLLTKFVAALEGGS